MILSSLHKYLFSEWRWNLLRITEHTFHVEEKDIAGFRFLYLHWGRNEKNIKRGFYIFTLDIVNPRSGKRNPGVLLHISVFIINTGLINPVYLETDVSHGIPKPMFLKTIYSYFNCFIFISLSFECDFFLNGVLLKGLCV